MPPPLFGLVYMQPLFRLSGVGSSSDEILTLPPFLYPIPDEREMSGTELPKRRLTHMGTDLRALTDTELAQGMYICMESPSEPCSSPIRPFIGLPHREIQ
jgi:hypothetical protein